MTWGLEERLYDMLFEFQVARRINTLTNCRGLEEIFSVNARTAILSSGYFVAQAH